MIRWEGTAENAGSPIGQEGGSLAICPTAREQLDAIAELDLRATGTPRGVLLDRLHREWPEAMQIAMVEGRIVGYSYVRPGSRAWQVGPVITFDAASGEALLDRAFHDHGGQPIHLDVPRENLPAMHGPSRMGSAFSVRSSACVGAMRCSMLRTSFGPVSDPRKVDRHAVRSGRTPQRTCVDPQCQPHGSAGPVARVRRIAVNRPLGTPSGGTRPARLAADRRPRGARISSPGWMATSRPSEAADCCCWTRTRTPCR